MFTHPRRPINHQNSFKIVQFISFLWLNFEPGLPKYCPKAQFNVLKALVTNMAFHVAFCNVTFFMIENVGFYLENQWPSIPLLEALYFSKLCFGHQVDGYSTILINYLYNFISCISSISVVLLYIFLYYYSLYILQFHLPRRRKIKVCRSKSQVKVCL